MRKNITVIAKMKSDGSVIPLKIVWSEIETYTIDKVLDIRKASATKTGGFGLRYTCKIKGIEKFLFLDDYVWFVEV